MSRKPSPSIETKKLVFTTLREIQTHADFTVWRTRELIKKLKALPEATCQTRATMQTVKECANLIWNAAEQEIMRTQYAVLREVEQEQKAKKGGDRS